MHTLVEWYRALASGQHMFVGPTAHQNGVKLTDDAGEIDRRIHNDPINLAVWAGNITIQAAPVSEKDIGPIFGPGASPLMDSNQAAQFLGVHPRTLQRMVLRGQIAGVRVGKLWRFVPSAIQDWITEHNIAS